jgi:hypothetical protein
VSYRTPGDVKPSVEYKPLSAEEHDRLARKLDMGEVFSRGDLALLVQASVPKLAELLHAKPVLGKGQVVDENTLFVAGQGTVTAGDMVGKAVRDASERDPK